MGGGEAKEPSASAVTPERVVSETALITASAAYKKAPSWTMTRRPPHQDPSTLQRSPGPAAYTLQSTMMEGCATGGFGSKTGDRFMTTPWQHRNPGPTDYTPKLPEETRVFNPSSKLFSLPTAGRQAGTHKAGMDSPGPAYYLHRHKNIGTDTRKAGFGFAVGPGLGHHEMSVKPRPGPDQYIIKSIFERNIEAKKGAGIGYGPRGQGTFGGLDNPDLKASMPPAEAKESSAEHVVRCCKCNAVVSDAGSRRSKRRSRRRHSSQRPPINRPKVPYDLQPPYAILGGFPEYKTDYMQLGNYPEDEMAFMPCWKQGPPTGRCCHSFLEVYQLRQYLMLLMFEELTIDEELFYFIL
ncbi:hypothetical protein FOZ62_012172 [Perkinsus olseni]|uniref:Uncharacterized protein n=1 Tax=Perkinsus olseni TaxID=32597 RepID=A0A7J6PGT9_PEROL|nr:hypothetical protein FOZ62_012172 [Perkinsus olseni]